MKKYFLILCLALAFLGSPAGAASPEGAVVLDGNTIYLITAAERRGFPSAEVFLSHGYKFEDAMPIRQMDFTKTEGAPLIYRDGTLVKGSGATVYIISEGVKRPFISGDVFRALGYSFGNVVTDTGGVLDGIRTGTVIYSGSISHPTGTLINHKGTIYVTSVSALKGIPSLEVFNSYGYKFKDVVPASIAFDMTMPVEEILKARGQTVAAAPAPAVAPPAASPPPAPEEPKNKPPAAPTVSGVKAAFPLTSQDFVVVSSDPEGKAITYTVDFGDGTDKFMQSAASGAKLTLSHSWKYNGDYTMTVAAQDPNANKTTTTRQIMIDNDTSRFGPAITLLAPNGGEKFIMGQPFTISWLKNWEPQQAYGKVDIYYRRGGLNFLVRSGAEGTSYSWTPVNIAAADDYKIVVQSQGTAGSAASPISDESDEVFGISAQVQGAVKRAY